MVNSEPPSHSTATTTAACGRSRIRANATPVRTVGLVTRLNAAENQVGSLSFCDCRKHARDCDRIRRLELGTPHPDGAMRSFRQCLAERLFGMLIADRYGDYLASTQAFRDS